MAVRLGASTPSDRLEPRVSDDIRSMPRRAEMPLPYKPESVRLARRFVHETLAEWGLDGLVDDALLVVSELVTNAAKTGCRRRMTVSVQRFGETSVRISVRDGSRSLPVLIRASAEDECHRGLELVDRLTGGRWGVELEPLGKVVHALLGPAGQGVR